VSAVQTSAKGKQGKQKDKETYGSAVGTAAKCPVGQDVKRDVYMWKEIQIRDLSALNHTYLPNISARTLQ